jgi:hypothetical protein
MQVKHVSSRSPAERQSRSTRESVQSCFQMKKLRCTLMTRHIANIHVYAVLSERTGIRKGVLCCSPPRKSRAIPVANRSHGVSGFPTSEEQFCGPIETQIPGDVPGTA